MLNVLEKVVKKIEEADVRKKLKEEKTKKNDIKKSVKKLKKSERRVLDIAENTTLPSNYCTVWTENDLDELCHWLKSNDMVAIDTETTGLNPFINEIVGMSFYAPDIGWYIPLKHNEDIRFNEEERSLYEISELKRIGVDYVECLPIQLVSRKLKPILEDTSKKYLFHNSKFDMHVIHNWLGIDVKPYFDTMVAQALLDENKSKALKDLAVEYLGIPADRFSTLFGKVTFDRVPIKLNLSDKTGNLATYYAVKDTELTYKLYEFQNGGLVHPALKEIKDLFFDVEMPFINIVWEAEQRGIKLDEGYLRDKVAVTLNNEIEELEKAIYGYADQVFNIRSPQQLSHVLYNILKLPQVNKKKPLSTDKKTLKKLTKIHPIVPLVLQYRAKAKLADAFVNKLPKNTVGGRVHTSFNTVGGRTGRMSSSNPNLQQIPAGNLIRNAFLADEGRLLASIDFSGQELRVLTHVSLDEVLLNIYASGKDVHNRTAVGMWNLTHPDEPVTYEYFDYCRKISPLFQDVDGNIVESLFEDSDFISSLLEEGKITTSNIAELRKDATLGIAFDDIRNRAKVVNFGIIYGMSVPGLSDTLNISEEEAAQYIDSYFDSYPGVREFILKEQENMLQRYGNYTRTLLGRKRRVYPEIEKGTPWARGRAFRMGVNAIIQGSSADMVKLASIKLQPLLKELDSHIVLWVHDEIIFDVPESIGMDNLNRLSDVMCNALPLVCGMESDIEVGRKWGQKIHEEDIDKMRQKYFEDFELGKEVDNEGVA